MQVRVRSDDPAILHEQLLTGVQRTDFLARPDPPAAFEKLRTMLAEGTALPP